MVYLELVSNEEVTNTLLALAETAVNHPAHFNKFKDLAAKIDPELYYFNMYCMLARSNRISNRQNVNLQTTNKTRRIKDSHNEELQIVD